MQPSKVLIATTAAAALLLAAAPASAGEAGTPPAAEPVGISFAAFGAARDHASLDSGLEVAFAATEWLDLVVEGGQSADTALNRGAAGVRLRLAPGTFSPFVYTKVMGTREQVEGGPIGTAVFPCAGVGIDWNAGGGLFLRLQEGYGRFFESRVAVGVSF